MNYHHRMPGPPPGRFPTNPFGVLTPRAVMNMANPRFAPTSLPRSDRAFYENGYDSGNDNRRRNAHRLRAERAEYKHMRQPPLMHAGSPYFGTHGLPGHRLAYSPGFNRMHNPYLAHTGSRQQGIRLPMPRMPAPYRVRIPTQGAPYSFRQQPGSYARRPAYRLLPRGYPPRPAARPPAYSTSLPSTGDEDDDDEFEYLNRMRPRGGRRNRDIIDDSDDDDYLDDDGFSTSSTRGFARSSRRPARSFDTEWSDEEEEDEDDDDTDDWDYASRFGMRSHRGPSRPYGERYYAR
jgi:hypothetical protein